MEFWDYLEKSKHLLYHPEIYRLYNGTVLKWVIRTKILSFLLQKKKKKCTSVPHSLTLHVKTNVYQYIFSRFIPGDIFEKINTTCPSEVTVRFEWAEEKGTRDWAFLNDGLEIFPLLCNFITRIDMCIFFKKKFKSLISVHTFKFKYRSL